jgi:hypothetical protein
MGQHILLQYLGYPSDISSLILEIVVINALATHLEVGRDKVLDSLLVLDLPLLMDSSTCLICATHTLHHGY